MDKEMILLDADQAAAFLNITKTYLYQLNARKKIPVKYIGTKVIYDKTELYDWVISGQSANA